MKNVLLILSIAAVLILFSCKKEQPPASGSISGNLSSYDPATPLVKTPVADIKLWLVNADFKFDTVTFAGNRAAIVDSTYSDANGNYRFDNIPLGNYYICPLPDTSRYRFEPAAPASADPIHLSETAPDQSMSFSSPWPGGENNSEFQVTITVDGMTSGDYYVWQRQYFHYDFPYFLANQRDDGSYYYYQNQATEHFLYGSTMGYLTETNNFLLEFYHSNDQWFDSYWIVQDLGNTPSESTWTIDLNAHTITKTSK